MPEVVRNRIRRAVTAPTPPASISGPVDAMLIGRMVSRVVGVERVDLAPALCDVVRDTRRPGHLLFEAIGIKLRDDLRSWLRAEAIPYGAFVDIIEPLALDAYLIIPNADDRARYAAKWGQA